MVRLVLFTLAFVGLSMSLGPSSWAETVAVACSPAQGGTPSTYFSVDLSSATVTMSSRAYSANITEDRIIWQTPARSEDGANFPATTFLFDRRSGVLELSGGTFVTNLFCQRATRVM